MSAEQLVQLDPAHVLADDNTRFNLKRLRIDSMKNSILEQGGINTPVEVEPLATPVNGFTHRLTSGFYRPKAAEELNKEQNAGVTLPAIVRELPDAKTRLIRQLTENMERENQSPMDRAVAVKKLLDAGVEKGEIRRLFATAGGRKGNQVQPMSNAMMNILLRFLDLPKTIQERIHDGRVGVAAAYELGKVAPEKRQAVLDAAEREGLQAIEREEKDEERYLQSEKKLAEAQEKEAQALKDAEQAKADAKAAELLLQEKGKLHATERNRILTMETPAQPADTEKLNAAAADVKAAQKLKKDAENRLAKALTTVKTAAETAEEHKAKLEAARKAVRSGKAGKGKGTNIGPGDIKKAAKVSDASAPGQVNLSMSEIRGMLKDMMKEGVPEKVQAIAKSFRDALDSKVTTKELIHDLGVICGDIKAAPAPVAPAKATPPAAPAVKQGPVGKK